MPIFLAEMGKYCINVMFKRGLGDRQNGYPTAK